MLRHSGVWIKLLRDVEIHTFIEKWVRGGFSSAVLKYAQSKNQLLPNFDSILPTTYIIYLDVNNSYGNQHNK